MSSAAAFLTSLLRLDARGGDDAEAPAEPGPTNQAGKGLPVFAQAPREPVELTHVKHPDGRMSSYPPKESWDDWVEWDSKAWPRKVPRNYTLVPTICFNCESSTLR